ncbi:MAG: hypothetical protein E7637_07160 [Ruminococcaceae bacterium]|nr:hypothetical protein [Oscillospiraceae bacterium]
MNQETQVNPLQPFTGEGYLIVQVSTARGAIPLEGARVNIRSYPPDLTAGRGDVIASLVSGSDGRTERLSLPAPNRTESMQPGSQKPFSTYNVEVHLEGYSDAIYQNVPIFDGIVAIQPAILIPLPENGRTDSRTPDGQRFFESSAPNL